MSEKGRLIFKGFKDSDFIFYDESSFEGYVKIDALKFFISEIQDIKYAIDLLEQDVKTITKKYNDITKDNKKYDQHFETLSKIMFELIDTAIENNNIIKIGYKFDDDLIFYIIFNKLNFELINFTSKLEVKMIKQNPDLNVFLEPCSIDEDYIDDEIKYFYVSDHGK